MPARGIQLSWKMSARRSLILLVTDSLILHSNMASLLPIWSMVFTRSMSRFVIPEMWQVVKLSNFMPLPLRGLSQAVIGTSLSVHRPVTSALPLRSMSRLRLLKSETSSSLTDPSIS